MSVLDDVFSKAKETFDVVGKKTEEVVSVQKLKLEASGIKSKRDRDLKELGRLCFVKFKDSGDLSPEMVQLIADIKEKSAKINQLNAEIAAMQSKGICPKCGAKIETDSNFCRSCGEKLVFDSAEE